MGEFRVTMRVHAVERFEPEEGRPAREIVHLKGVDDGSGRDREWSSYAMPTPGWATCSLEVSKEGRLGELVKGRLVNVTLQTVEPREVTLTPDSCSIRGTALKTGS